MLHSSVGGLIEAAPAAEESESDVLQVFDLIGRWRVEILKSEIRITSVTGPGQRTETHLSPLSGFQLPAWGKD